MRLRRPKSSNSHQYQTIFCTKQRDRDNQNRQSYIQSPKCIEVASFVCHTLNFNEKVRDAQVRVI